MLKIAKNVYRLEHYNLFCNVFAKHMCSNKRNLSLIISLFLSCKNNM